MSYIECFLKNALKIREFYLILHRKQVFFKSFQKKILLNGKNNVYC